MKLFSLFTLLLYASLIIVRSKEGKCVITRDYVASAWEEQWLLNSEELSHGYHNRAGKWHHGCKKMQDDKELVDKWLDYWWTRGNFTLLPDKGASLAEEFPRDVFSYIKVTQTCGEEVKEVKHPIEPLVGFLRHPLSHCFRNTNEYLLNKDYMLTDFLYEAYPFTNLTEFNDDKPRRRNYLFDLGASLYTSGLGGASQSWFVDSYKDRGIVFDRILAWEGTFASPEQIFSEYPPEVYSKVSYFNVLARTGLNDPGNPLRILKEIAHEDDYVSFKLDIDNPEVELSFIEQILNDTSVSGLIDELYFEHHVYGTPLELIWFGRFMTEKERKSMNNLQDSMHMFRNLRKRGIKAHSWV